MKKCDCGRYIDTSMESHLTEELNKLYDVLHDLGFSDEQIREMKEV